MFLRKGLPADAMISNNGLTILQQEVDLPPSRHLSQNHSVLQAVIYLPKILFFFDLKKPLVPALGHGRLRGPRNALLDHGPTVHLQGDMLLPAARVDG